MGFWRRIWAFVDFARHAGRRAIEIGGDVVFATSTPLTIAIPAVRAAKALRIPMVFEVRDLWPELPVAMGIIKNPLIIFLARQLERFAYRNASHIVALSPGMAKGIHASGYPDDAITVIPNSANNALFGAASQSAEEFFDDFPEYRGERLVIYTGALGEANGVDYLVRIAANMLDRDPAIRFLVVGDGKLRGGVEALAHELGVLNKNFRIIDPIPKARMPSLLGAATVACSLLIDLPEMANSSPNKFFDALAAGTPVMINWKGWLADLVRDHDAGLVIPPNDAVEAASLLSEFLSNPDAVEVAGRNAGELARQNFDKDMLAERLRGVLETTCAR